MDAKQRAQFINAQNFQPAAAPGIKRCPKCNAEVKGKFCSKCGTRYEEPIQPQTTRPEPIRQQTTRPEPIRQQTTRPEPIQPRTTQPETMQQQTTRPEPIQPQTTQPKRIQPQAVSEEPERESALAKGLPEWSIEPPQIVVRRKRR